MEKNHIIELQQKMIDDLRFEIDLIYGEHHQEVIELENNIDELCSKIYGQDAIIEYLESKLDAR